MRWALAVPAVLMALAIVTGAMGYADTKASLKADLDRAVASMIAARADYFTSADTVAALRRMGADVGHPLCQTAVPAHDLRHRPRRILHQPGARRR